MSEGGEAIAHAVRVAIDERGELLTVRDEFEVKVCIFEAGW